MIIRFRVWFLKFKTDGFSVLESILMELVVVFAFRVRIWVVLTKSWVLQLGRER